MPLNEVIIDEQTWDGAPHTRQLEWDINIRELLSGPTLVFLKDAQRLSISMNEQRFYLEIFDADGQSLQTHSLPHQILKEQIQEYVDVVREISNAQSSGKQHRVDALDMAKKVTHDRAGRIIKRELKPLEMDLTTTRRLFTLLLSIRVDTTRLTGIYGHRRIR